MLSTGGLLGPRRFGVPAAPPAGYSEVWNSTADRGLSACRRGDVLWRPAYHVSPVKWIPR